MLTTVSPKSMAEDEMNIGKAYRSGQKQVLFIAAFIAATTYYSDLKWTVFAAAVSILFYLDAQEGRLYDIIIRTQRTNKLIRQMAANDE